LACYACDGIETTNPDLETGRLTGIDTGIAVFVVCLP